MYLCTNFQSVRRTSDSETKFDKKNMTDKTFDKNKH